MEIVENLEAALDQFRGIVESLEGNQINISVGQRSLFSLWSEYAALLAGRGNQKNLVDLSSHMNQCIKEAESAIKECSK